ncbi:S8 family serine peptidase [Caldithrix abyssi]
MKPIFLIFFFFYLHSLSAADVYFAKLTATGQEQLKRNNLLKPAGISYKTFQTYSKPLPLVDRWLVVEADSQKLHELQAENWIETFEPVRRFKIFPLTNDSLSAEQWYLEQINIEQAWQVTRGAPDVLLAVIDTGIDYTHPDLQEVLWINEIEQQGLPGVDDDGNGLIDDVMGWDFTDAPRFADGGDYLTPDPDPMDEFLGGHGTEIAGIIGATVNNLKGIAGIAPQIKIMNLRAGTAAGYLEEDDVIQAMLYAYSKGAKIINMSFGDVKVSTLFRDVLRFLWEKGITFVAAAGNEGQPQIYYPAAFKETIAVGSCDRQDHLSAFSNFGPGLDLIAPGAEIISTAPGNKYRTVSGTSFSAPMAAGVCALLLSARPDLSNEELRTVLKNSAEQNLPNPQWQVGSGRLDAGKALLIQHGGTLQIISPTENTPVKDSLFIVGSAYHPDLQSVLLEYGLGSKPERWFALGKWDYRYFYHDTLALLPIDHIPDTVLTIRLQMQLLNQTSVFDLTSIHVDRTPPRILKLTLDPAFQKAEIVGLLHLITDDQTTAHVTFSHSSGSVSPDSLVDLNLFSEHFLTFTSRQIADYNLLKIQVKNDGGLIADTTLNVPEIFFADRQWHPWRPLKHTLPAGYLLHKFTDINRNEQREIVLSEYASSGAIGYLKVWEDTPQGFEQIAEFSQKTIPRDAFDMDGDGREELLVTYGSQARLLKFDSGLKTFRIVWQDSGFWAAALTDCNKNGKAEIIGYRDSAYVALEDQGNFQFLPIARLINHSKGENRFGSPKVVVHDFNGDGNNELVFGDYDGDLNIYSCSGADQFHLLQLLHTYQTDATDLIEAGGDALFVLSHTEEGRRFESELAQLYWSLEIFTYDARWRELKSSQIIHFYPYSLKKTFDAGMRFSEYNGRQYLFLALYPSFFVLEKIEGRWAVVWQTESCRSNAIVAGESPSSQNFECYFNTGEKIVGFFKGEGEALSVPFGLNASPLDSARIKIEWQGQNYNGFNLYRGLSAQSLQFYRHVSQNAYLDQNLTLQETYFYAVTAVADSLESEWSNIDSASTGRPPRLLSVQRVGKTAFILQFDQFLKLKADQPPRIFWEAARIAASSIVLIPPGHSLLVIFDDLRDSDFTEDTLKVENVFNAQDMPIDRRYDWTALDLAAPIEAPRVTKLNIVARTTIVVTFSQPMDSGSVQQLSHYQLFPAGSVSEVTVLNALASEVELTLTKEAPAGAFGQAAYLEIYGVKNRWGVEMAERQKFSLFRPEDDLSRVIIYPQPVRPQDEALIFAKLPQKAQIQIFNMHGLLIRTLEQVNEYGGIRWDLRDASGKRASSGVYFYRIIYGKHQKTGKLVIVR